VTVGVLVAIVALIVVGDRVLAALWAVFSPHL